MLPIRLTSESKLGKGFMNTNVTQHQDFMPKFERWSELCGKILAKEAEYCLTEFVDLLRQSTDVLHVHLIDEIATLEVSRIATLKFTLTVQPVLVATKTFHRGGAAHP